MSYPNTILTKTVRRVIMCCLIAIFFIVTPLIILYTAGYRYDFASGQIKQTGVISIDVLPKDVNVYLSNVKIEKRMPIRLANRAPGTYHLLLEKTGFKPWEKDITVGSKQTTYIKNVSLFPQTQPTVYFSSNSTDSLSGISMSYDGSYMTLTTSEKNIFTIYLLETSTKKKTVIKKLTSESKPIITWSPWQPIAAIISKSSSTPSTYDLDLITPAKEGISRTLAINSASSAPKFQWQKNTPGMYVETYAPERSIMSVRANAVSKLFDLSDDNTAWFIDAKDSLWIYSSTNKTIKKNNSNSDTYYDLPDIVEFLDINESRIVARTATDIKSIKIPSGESERIFASNMRLNQNTNEWLAWSQSELWSIYEDGNVVLLDRRQENIEEVLPLDQYGLILIATDKKLYGYNPGYAVSHELLGNGAIYEKNYGIGVSERQKNIYFIGGDKTKKDVYVLHY